MWEKEDDFNQCLNWAVPEPFTLFEIFTLRKYLAKKTTGHLSVFAAYLGAILERSALFCPKQINQLRLFFRSQKKQAFAIGISSNLQVGSEHYAVIYDGNALRQNASFYDASQINQFPRLWWF